MASKESYKQDLVISIRYKNDLPPPPMPPKLLDIDTGGLQQYLDPGFAASIAKREEPNIEADAEGGMPIDVVGMYGYFDGDESSIMAPEITRLLDPEDEALMLTPEQLRAGGAMTGSNFLRKTQYMTATSAPTTTDPSRSAQPRIRKDKLSKPAVLARDDKENIKRNILKAFDLAYQPKSSSADAASINPQERSAWNNPVHPSNKSLRPVSFYPMLPDFEAATAIGSSWNLLRFDRQPLPPLRGNHRDNRIDAAFLMAQEHPEKKAAWEQQKAAYDADPNSYDDPGNAPALWSLLVPRDQAATPFIRKLMNLSDPEHADVRHLARISEEDEKDHTHKIPLDRTKTYSNATSQDKDPGRHTRQVVLTLSDPQSSSANTGTVQYYPIGQVTKFLPERGTLASSQKSRHDADATGNLADQVLLLPRDPDNTELANRYYSRSVMDPEFAYRFEIIHKAALKEQEERGESDQQGQKERPPTDDHEDDILAATEQLIAEQEREESADEDVNMDDVD